MIVAFRVTEGHSGSRDFVYFITYLAQVGSSMPYSTSHLTNSIMNVAVRPIEHSRLNV